MNQINEYMELTRASDAFNLSNMDYFERKRPCNNVIEYPKYDNNFQKKVNQCRKKNKLANKARSKNRKQK